VEEDAQDRRQDDRCDEAGRVTERRRTLQRIEGEWGDLVGTPQRPQARGLVGNRRLDHAERNRDDEDDRQERRERAIVRRTKQPAHDDVEHVIRRVHDSQDHEEQRCLMPKVAQGARRQRTPRRHT
jgi:hypothetical protein